MTQNKLSKILRLPKAVSLLWAATATLSLSTVTADAQSYGEYVRQANQNTVTIVSSVPGETGLSIANDLATVLHCVNGLRVIPVTGRGGDNNIFDLLFLRGIDMAIVPADVLDHIQESKKYIADLKRKVSYVAPLFTEEVHLLAGDDIKSIQDLEGKFVNMGAPGTLALAAKRILADAGVNVIASKFDNELALDRVIDGQIDAMFVVGGKPVALFDSIGSTQGLHLVNLDPIKDMGVYVEGSISYNDYPGLVQAGADVSTISVPSVLAVYDWPKSHPRYAKNKLFVETLFNRMHFLRRPSRHPKWTDVNPLDEVPGWNRFSASEEMVAALTPEPVEEPEAAASVTTGTATQAETQEQSLEEQFKRQLFEYGITPQSDEERSQLFEAFKRRIEREQ